MVKGNCTEEIHNGLSTINNNEDPERIANLQGRILEDNQMRNSQPGPSQIIVTNINLTSKMERKKWSFEEYKEVMWCFFYIVQTTGTQNNKKIYDIWRNRNPNNRPNLNSNTLATQRRFIQNHTKLSEEQLKNIRDEVSLYLQNTNLTENGDIQIQETKTPINNHVQGINIENFIVSDDQIVTERNNDYDEQIRQKILSIMKNYDESIENRKPLKKLNNTKLQNQLIHETNLVIENILSNISMKYITITYINNIIYAAAQYVIDTLIPESINNNIRYNNEEPPWKRRLQRKIDELRKDISQLVEIKNGVNTYRMKFIKNKLFNKYNIENDNIITIIEKLKQKLQAKASRIKRYEKRTKFYKGNKLFNENQTKFYNELRQNNKIVEQPPKEREIEQFWKQIWQQDVEHNKNANWIKSEMKQNSEIKEMEWYNITEIEVKNALSKTMNWKTPGSDGIQNYWLKKFTSTHKFLAQCYNDIIQNKQNIPNWLMKGNTYLIPKNNDTTNPKNYRPITCLSTTYKNLTSIITNRLQKHLFESNLYPQEQKGCIQNSYGPKDHLLISKTILESCKKDMRNLSVAWIDYKKAYDSVPHSWLIEILKINKVPEILINFMEKSMKEWKVDLKITTKEKNISINNIEIKKGIFQGDSLSPLLFCMSLIPLTTLLNKSDTGYKIKNCENKINHLLYVDDLKLIAKNDKELEKQLKIVKQFSDDIRMEFGLDKCAKATFIRGKLQLQENIQLDADTIIKTLQHNEVYKYLGIDENNGIQDQEMKLKIKTKYFKRVRVILKTELNSKNKFMALTSLAVPIIQYSIGIIKWTKEEIRKLDTKTRKLLTLHGLLHPRADIDRLYIPRSEGGRGLINIEMMNSLTIKSLAAYIKLKQSDKFLSMVYISNKNRIDEILNDQIEEEQINSTNITKTEIERVKEIKIKMKNRLINEKKDIWHNKVLHGQFSKETKKQHVDEKSTWLWLKNGELKGETEALITSCQDQAIATNYFKTRILKTAKDEKCRLCKTEKETIQHIISACNILAKKEYLERHNAVAGHLHYNICKHYKIEVNDKWYLHKPEEVIETPDVTILWDTQIQTDRHIPANKPDIIIKDKRNNTCLIIDVAIPSDYNILQKEAEKRIKYRDLQIEIQRMWNLKAKIVPVIIGTTGLISTNLSKIINEVPGQHNIKILQKTVILRTAHIIRKIIY